MTWGLPPLVTLLLIGLAGGFWFQPVAVVTFCLSRTASTTCNRPRCLGAFVLSGIVTSDPAGTASATAAGWPGDRC